MNDLTIEELNALKGFARENGRNWKSQLRQAWETGNYAVYENAAVLQAIRNQRGPSWLVRFRLEVD